MPTAWHALATHGATRHPEGGTSRLRSRTKSSVGAVNEHGVGAPCKGTMGDHGGECRVEAAYRAVHPRLWRALLAFTGDAELASDAESEAFAQVLRRGDAVDDVAAWVWRSAFRIAAGLLAAGSLSSEFGA